MPKLRDLYGIDLRPKAAYSSVMERPLTDVEREQRAAPIDRPYASGQLEAPMFAPDDLIGSGIPTKLAALAKGSIPAIAGIFIGPKHPAWNREATELALQMKANGVDPRSIWKTTQTFTEFPGIPAVQELSDKGTGLAKFGDAAMDEASNMYPHPRLYEGYPKLRESLMAAYPDSSQGGEYYRTPTGHGSITAYGPSRDEASSVALHELQHGVLDAEGWDPGTSIAGIIRQFPKEIDVNRKYLTHQGEAAARMTQARRDMDDVQRRMQYPMDSIPGIKLSDLWSK